MMTPPICYGTQADQQAHVKYHYRYANCEHCRLKSHRTNICHYRGIIPADVLVIGLHPTAQDDTAGHPLTGKKASILRELLHDHFVLTDQYLTYGFTTAVACLPTKMKLSSTDIEYRTTTQPSPKEISYCRNRLSDLINIVRPHTFLILGSATWNNIQPRLKTGYPKARFIQMCDPGYILRKGGKESTEYNSVLRHLTRHLKQKVK